MWLCVVDCLVEFDIIFEVVKFYFEGEIGNDIVDYLVVDGIRESFLVFLDVVELVDWFELVLEVQLEVKGVLVLFQFDFVLV